MNPRAFYFIIILLSFALTSCMKDKAELLSGTWERVNVENINDPYTHEWVFDNGELIIQRRLKSQPTLSTVSDRGFYLLETNPLKTTLQIMETSNEIMNESWDVIKLDNEQLIIKLDIVGGVLYREFVKIF